MQDSRNAARRKALPPELLKYRRWIAWDLMEGRKKPRGSTLVPEHWHDYDEIAHEEHVGFVLTNGVIDSVKGRLLALDIDACLDPKTGAVADWAAPMRAQYPSTFWEITPSGTGLRCWLWIKRLPPAPLRTCYVDAPSVDGKQPQIQIFGQGPAGYVAVTGDVLPGPSFIGVVESLDWLVDAFDFEHAAAPTTELRAGLGEAPTTEEVHRMLDATERTCKLRDARWQDLGFPSASEAYFELVTHVVRAARGHQHVAFCVLLELETWGRGLVDSREPQRYASEKWVRAEVARVASKLDFTHAGEVFDVLEVSPSDVLEASPPVEKPRRIVHYREARDRADDQSAWLVYQTIPRVGLVQLFGDPGAAKTPVAMSLAAHVAGDAATWWGRDIDTHGAVVYMAGEGFSGLVHRFAATCAAIGVDPAIAPIYVTTQPGQLSDAADVRVWIDELRRIVDVEATRTGKRLPIRMLVVDTQAQNFGAGNENSSEDMNAFVQHAQTIARVFSTCVLLVHHTGHEHKTRARGSSVMIAALDACYEITRAGVAVAMTPRKLKEGPIDETLRGTLEVVPIGVDRRQRPITTVRLRTSEPAPNEIAAAAGAVSDVEALVVEHVRRLAGEPTSAKRTSVELGIPKRVASDALARLTAIGVLTRVKGGARSRTSIYGVTVDSVEPARKLDDLLS